MFVELLTHKTLKGRKNCNICFNDIQYNRVSDLLKEAQERNIRLTCVEGKHCKCLGDMFRSNGNLTYGAMVCERCIEQELCREISGGNKNVVIAKLDEHLYSITHWQTGIALSKDRYARKKDAIDALPEVIEKIRKTNMSIKQFCERYNLKQINF